MIEQCDLKKIIKDFEVIKTGSTLCRLLLGKDSRIYWDFKGSREYSLAFLAYYRGDLSKLDTVLEKFDIEKKGVPQFKNNLKEEWLDEHDDKERFKKKTRVLGFIVELFVADYLLRHDELIIKLSALDGGSRSDIESKNTNKEYFTEVKYLGEMPDIQKLKLEQRRSGDHAKFEMLSPLDTIYHYINIRIGEALSQLEKSNIDFENRRVFIVMDNSFIEGYKILVDWLNRGEDWNKGPNLQLLLKALDLTEKKKKYIIGNSVEDNLNKIKELVIGFLSQSWDLEIYRKIRK